MVATDPAKVTGALLHGYYATFQEGEAAPLDPTASVRARRSPGGGSFEAVAEQVEALRARVG